MEDFKKFAEKSIPLNFCGKDMGNLEILPVKDYLRPFLGECKGKLLAFFCFGLNNRTRRR